MQVAPVRLDIAAEVRQLREELSAHADARYAAGLRRIVPSQLPAHFVRLADVRRIGVAWSRAHRDATASELIDLVDALWATGWREEGIVGMILLSRSREALLSLPWSAVAAWSARFDNWEHVDNAAMLVTGPMLVRRPGLIADLRVMAGSDQPWQRRLALVTLIVAARRDASWAPELAAMTRRLTGDTGPTLRKAVAWAARVLRQMEGQIAG